MIYNKLSWMQKTVLHIKSFFVLSKKGIMVCRTCGFKSEYIHEDDISENGITDCHCYEDGWVLYNFERRNYSIIFNFFHRKIYAIYRCPICGAFKYKNYSYFLSERKFDCLVNMTQVRHRNYFSS
jgi:rubrerythrin